MVSFVLLTRLGYNQVERKDQYTETKRTVHMRDHKDESGNKREFKFGEVLGEKTDEELKEMLKSLYADERKLSYQRRLIHGRIDILKEELARRLKQKLERGERIAEDLDIEDLTRILAHPSPPLLEPDLDGEA